MHMCVCVNIYIYNNSSVLIDSTPLELVHTGSKIIQGNKKAEKLYLK